MKNLIRLKKPRVARPVRLAASALAVVAVVAVVAGIVAGKGSAAPATKADESSHSRKKHEFMRPKVTYGPCSTTVRAE